MEPFLKQLSLRNILSFGEEETTIPLGPLNVIIGANGSGKSNLIDAISLLRSSPRDMASVVREGGGVANWLWKGSSHPTATIEAIVENSLPGAMKLLRHTISFTESNGRFELIDERIEEESTRTANETEPYFFYRFQNNRPVLNVKDGQRMLRREDVDPEKSILAQRKDPDQYPEISFLAESYDKIRVYREWSFGRNSPPRQPQKADQRNDFLQEDCANLGLILNSLQGNYQAKQEMLEHLSALYPTIVDFGVLIEGGSVQVFLNEADFSIPATRLSDGTLRYLCLLAILCHPSPPPVVCIEEPELGLHPDVIVDVGKLLKSASERCQLIVTTHSDVLLDCLSDTPEDVLVFEKEASSTTVKRLNAESLKSWLNENEYSLGHLWRSGEIGGNRW